MKIHRAVFALSAVMPLVLLSAVTAFAQTKPASPQPSPSTPAPSPSPAPAPTYESLMEEGKAMRAEIRKIPCYMPGMLESLWAWVSDYSKRIGTLESTDYPRRRHEPKDWHIDRLDTVQSNIVDLLYDLEKKPCIPKDMPQPQTPPAPPPAPPAPPAPKAEAAPEHSSTSGAASGGELAGMYANDWTILANYQHFDPKTGDSAHQWGIAGAGLIQVGEGIAVNFGGGYNNVSGDHLNLDNWYGSATLVWEKSDVRFGPTAGYQSNAEDFFHARTWNYGGFVDYYHTSDITFGAKAGGFSTSGTGADSSGYYLGGSVTGYWNPNLSTAGSIDYTHFSPSGGSSETDYGLRVGWRPCPTTPVSLWGGYTYSTFGPGSFTVNTISVGVMLDLGSGQTLIESDRGGTVITQTGFAPLSLRF